MAQLLLLKVYPFTLTRKKRATKFSSAKFKKIIQAISNSEFKDWRANSVDLDEVAHY